MNFKKICLILMIFVVAIAAINCGNKKNGTGTGGATPSSAQTGGSNDVATAKTANGTTVISASALPQEKLTVINDSVNDLIEDAKTLGFKDDLDPNAYTVYVVSGCEPSASGVMSFRVRADDYDGSVYDKNPAPGIGEILAAEQVIMNLAEPSNSWKICDDDAATMTNTARFGLEHILLFHNSYSEYVRTVNHSNGTFHPLIPSRNK